MPHAVYCDCKNAFVLNREPTVEEQLSGIEPQIHFEKVCWKPHKGYCCSRSAGQGPGGAESCGLSGPVREGSAPCRNQHDRGGEQVSSENLSVENQREVCPATDQTGRRICPALEHRPVGNHVFRGRSDGQPGFRSDIQEPAVSDTFEKIPQAPPGIKSDGAGQAGQIARHLFQWEKAPGQRYRKNQTQGDGLTQKRLMPSDISIWA